MAALPPSQLGSLDSIRQFMPQPKRKRPLELPELGGQRGEVRPVAPATRASVDVDSHMRQTADRRARERGQPEGIRGDRRAMSRELETERARSRIVTSKMEDMYKFIYENQRSLPGEMLIQNFGRADPTLTNITRFGTRPTPTEDRRRIMTDLIVGMPGGADSFIDFTQQREQEQERRRRPPRELVDELAQEYTPEERRLAEYGRAFLRGEE